MKRFRKFRDPRFALTTLQNTTWEVRTRAELIQAAQDALAHHPDAAELPFAARPSAPIIPPPATTIPTPAIEPPLADARRQPQPQSEAEPELHSQPEVRPVPSTVPDVAPIPRPLPKVAAKGSAKRTRNSKPQPKRQPQPVHLSKIVAGTDAAEFVAEALDRHAKKAAGPHRNRPSKLPTPERHSRKCAICHHPNRADIEEDFLCWRDADLIQKEYELPNYHTIYRHAHTHGLYERRRGNLRFAAELLIEHADQAQPDANVILRAIRACACINDRGEWVEPARRVIYSSRDQQAAAAPAPQSTPQPEFQQSVREAASSTQSPASISSNTDANSPILINNPKIRK